jgi:hypothetical protein
MTIVRQDADGPSSNPTIATVGARKLVQLPEMKRTPPLLNVPLDIAFEVTATFAGKTPELTITLI